MDNAMGNATWHGPVDVLGDLKEATDRTLKDVGRRYVSEQELREQRYQNLIRLVALIVEQAGGEVVIDTRRAAMGIGPTLEIMESADGRLAKLRAVSSVPFEARQGPISPTR